MEPTWRGPGKMQFSAWQGLGNKYIILHDEEIRSSSLPSVCAGCAIETSASAPTASW